MRIPPHAGYGFVEFDTREQAQAAIDATNGSRIGGRPVAVDFAYDARLYKVIRSKDKPVENRSNKGEEVKEEVAVETPKTAAICKTKLPSSMRLTPAAKKQKTGPAQSEEARKLFMVNVPFDATRVDIQEGMCKFGSIEASDIESILIIKDKDTGKSSGKAFVVFSTVEIATKVLDVENSSLPILFGDLYKKKNQRSATAPIEGAGCLVLGRKVSIMKPLTKQELEKQKLAKEEESNPKNPKVVNRKNIDFVNAGWLNESSPEFLQLSPKDQKLRQACNQEKKFKLSNTNFVINTKRVTIRNIPKRMENGDLQAAILKAMKISGPKKTKQAGIIKVAIVKDKMMVPAEGGDKAPAVRHFDMNEVSSDDETPTTGVIKMKHKKRSRGFAFVDFTNSENAMRCLEAVNNVPGAFGILHPVRRPIVEFSFDDVRKLQIQKQRALKQSPVPQTRAVHKVKKVIMGRGKKQRMKKRAAREAAASAAAFRN